MNSLTGRIKFRRYDSHKDEELPSICEQSVKQQISLKSHSRIRCESSDRPMKPVVVKKQYYNKWYIPPDKWNRQKVLMPTKSEILLELSKNPDLFYQRLYKYTRENPLSSEKVEDNPKYQQLMGLQEKIAQSNVILQLKDQLEEQQKRIPNFLKILQKQQKTKIS